MNPESINIVSPQTVSFLNWIHKYHIFSRIFTLKISRVRKVWPHGQFCNLVFGWRMTAIPLNLTRKKIYTNLQRWCVSMFVRNKVEIISLPFWSISKISTIIAETRGRYNTHEKFKLYSRIWMKFSSSCWSWSYKKSHGSRDRCVLLRPWLARGHSWNVK